MRGVNQNNCHNSVGVVKIPMRCMGLVLVTITSVEVCADGMCSCWPWLWVESGWWFARFVFWGSFLFVCGVCFVVLGMETGTLGKLRK